MKGITVIVSAVLVFSLAGCAGGAPSQSAQAAQTPAQTAAAPAAPEGIVIETNPGPGPYTATAGGFHGIVSVTLDVKDGRLVSVKAEGHEETPGIGSLAIDTMPQAMLKGNTIVVDVVTGATFTSNGILEAAEKALAKAGLSNAGLKR